MKLLPLPVLATFLISPLATLPLTAQTPEKAPKAAKAPAAKPKGGIAKFPGVTVQTDLDYLGPDRKEEADLYLPEEDASKPASTELRPAVVMIHGGGWTGGDKGAAREQNIGNTLASHGYVALSINYRLHDPKSPPTEVCWPQNLHDCKTAVRWLRQNAAKLRIDPARIGAIGGSAGGHLTSMLAVTQAKDGLDPKGPYGDQPCDIKCAVDLYGPIEFSARDLSPLRQTRAQAPDLYKAFTVTTYLDKTDPPFLIMHGTSDTTVDVSQSHLFAKALEQAGIPYQLEIIEGAPHTFHLQPKQKDLRPITLAFFDKYLK